MKLVCDSVGAHAECNYCGAAHPHEKTSCEPCPFVTSAKCEPVKINCTTCKHFRRGLGVYYPYAEQIKAIGECGNKNVPTRICVSYGMICRGELHEMI